MGKLILFTGGCRSGKSRIGLAYADKKYSRKIFLATSEALDDEMKKRIKCHRKKRGRDWQTAEEPTDLNKVFEKFGANAQVILIDCVTLWLSNLLMKKWSAEKIFKYVDEILKKIKCLPSDVIFITNEVGSGIVPDNKLARDFRDITGTVNQKIAAYADAVIFMVSGIPVCIKGNIDVKGY